MIEAITGNVVVHKPIKFTFHNMIPSDVKHITSVDGVDGILRGLLEKKNYTHNTVSYYHTPRYFVLNKKPTKVLDYRVKFIVKCKEDLHIDVHIEYKRPSL